MGFAGCAFVALAMTDKGELADDPEVDLVGIRIPAHPAVAAAVIRLEHFRGRGLERGLRLVRLLVVATGDARPAKLELALLVGLAHGERLRMRHQGNARGNEFGSRGFNRNRTPGSGIAMEMNPVVRRGLFPIGVLGRSATITSCVGAA